MYRTFLSETQRPCFNFIYKVMNSQVMDKFQTSQSARLLHDLNLIWFGCIVEEGVGGWLGGGSGSAPGELDEL